jgi:hypothetical protein
VVVAEAALERVAKMAAAATVNLMPADWNRALEALRTTVPLFRRLRS